jgi:hypothetical protein
MMEATERARGVEALDEAMVLEVTDRINGGVVGPELGGVRRVVCTIIALVPSISVLERCGLFDRVTLRELVVCPSSWFA